MISENQEILTKVESFPEKPGIYLFKDKGNKIIYIGKAKSVKKRIKSYFNNNPTNKKIEKIQKLAFDIDFILTNSETEALILENEMIKKHQPILNARLKDDKTYPYLKVTISEEIPRVEIVRKREEDANLYFGPFSDVKSLRYALKKALTIFPIARCNKKIFYGKEDRTCLFYQLKRCLAPCAEKIKLETYKSTVKQFIKFLEGKQQELLKEISDEMEKAANELEFEKAALLRDKLMLLEKIVQKQTIVAKNPNAEYDILGVRVGEEYSLIQILIIRNGRIIEQKYFIINCPFDMDESEILSSFIKQYYFKTNYIPKTILTNVTINDKETINEWLNPKRKDLQIREDIIKLAQTKEEIAFVELAYKNASSHFNMNSKMLSINEIKIEKSLEELKEVVGLIINPKRIEGYDVSTLMGSESVGVSVVFEMGKPVKKDYRKFIIKTITKQDDYASLKEIIRRRFTGSLTKKEIKPDLILIDGGKNHVNVIYSVLKDLKINIPIIGLAKEFEEIHFANEKESIKLSERSEILKLFQRIRDEAHRFAISFHQERRSKKMIESSLEKIPKIGEKRINLLLEHFKTFDNIKNASTEELKEIPGISEKLAEKITSYYKNHLK